MQQAKTTGVEKVGNSGVELSTFELRISQNRVWSIGAEDPVDCIIWLNQLTSVSRSAPKAVGGGGGPKLFTPSAATNEELASWKKLDDRLACFDSDAETLHKTNLADTPRTRALTQALMKMLDECDENSAAARRKTTQQVSEVLNQLEEEIFNAEADDKVIEDAVKNVFIEKANEGGDESLALVAAKLRNAVQTISLRRPDPIMGVRKGNPFVQKKTSTDVLGTLKIGAEEAGSLLANLGRLSNYEASEKDEEDEEDEEDSDP
jgi:hypothetical protein